MDANILIVDDEQEIADLVELYLRNEGFTVFKYYTAGEALNDYYPHLSYTIIFMA